MTSTTKIGSRVELRRQLSRHFQPSRIEIQDRAHAGVVTRRGALLTVMAGVPAKPFRVVEAGEPRRLRRHVMDFARVDIDADGTVQAESTPLTVPRGTPVVILDVELVGNEVHLLAHTAEPLRIQLDGDRVYGCTEFVFRFDPAALDAGAIDPVFTLIGRWLAGPQGERVCRGGLGQLCIEP